MRILKKLFEANGKFITGTRNAQRCSKLVRSGNTVWNGAFYKEALKHLPRNTDVMQFLSKLPNAMYTQKENRNGDIVLTVLDPDKAVPEGKDVYRVMPEEIDNPTARGIINALINPKSNNGSSPDLTASAEIVNLTGFFDPSNSGPAQVPHNKKGRVLGKNVSVDSSNVKRPDSI